MTPTTHPLSWFIERIGKTVESKCQTCGGYNPVWSADNKLFNEVNGSPNGIICPTCFVKKANEKGIEMFGIKTQTNTYDKDSADTIADLEKKIIHH